LIINNYQIHHSKSINPKSGHSSSASF
jgi:hypothetical protein